MRVNSIINKRSREEKEKFEFVTDLLCQSYVIHILLLLFLSHKERLSKQGPEAGAARHF